MNTYEADARELYLDAAPGLFRFPDDELPNTVTLLEQSAMVRIQAMQAWDPATGASSPEPRPAHSGRPARSDLVERVGLADDHGAECVEVAHQVGIAAVDVGCTRHQRLTVGHQAGEDERGAGPDVGGLDGCGGEPLDAGDGGVVAVGVDLGTESGEFLDEDEPAVVQVLGDRSTSRR